MSNVCLITVKNNKLAFIDNHYRKIEKLLKRLQKRQNNTEYRSLDLDGGYLLIDLDNKIIINHQSCFTPETKNDFFVLT